MKSADLLGAGKIVEGKKVSMHADIDRTPEERYFICTSFFTKELIDWVKLGISKFMVSRVKDDLHYQFLDWQKQENELLVLTSYAYATIALPKTFDIVFELENPENFVNCYFKITKVILNNWMAFNEISCGHKHIAVLQFEDEIPAIFASLPRFTQDVSVKTALGFCNKKDFFFIKECIQSRASDVGQ